MTEQPNDAAATSDHEEQLEQPEDQDELAVARELQGGMVAGNNEDECAWLETGTGNLMEFTLPEGWSVQFSPVRIVGTDGQVAAEEGDNLMWDPVDDDTGRQVVCELDDPQDTRHIPEEFDIQQYD